MCGISGHIKTGKRFTKTAFWAGAVRGTDGIGVVGANLPGSSGKATSWEIDKKGRWKRVSKVVDTAVYYTKEPSPPTGDSAVLRHIAGMRNTSWAILHHRATTSGASIKENTHPFDYSNVVGVHNGHLTPGVVGHNGIEAWRKYKPVAEVDSAYLYASIDQANTLDQLAKVLRSASEAGAFALVWYDKGRESIRMIRNDERPLSFALMRDGGVRFASEAGMLEWLASRSTLYTSGGSILSMQEIDPGVLYEFPVSSPDKYTENTLDIAPRYYSYSYGGGYDGAYYSRYDDAQETSYDALEYAEATTSAPAGGKPMYTTVTDVEKVFKVSKRITALQKELDGVDLSTVILTRVSINGKRGVTFRGYLPGKTARIPVSVYTANKKTSKRLKGILRAGNYARVTGVDWSYAHISISPGGEIAVFYGNADNRKIKVRKRKTFHASLTDLSQYRVSDNVESADIWAWWSEASDMTEFVEAVATGTDVYSEGE